MSTQNLPAVNDVLSILRYLGQQNATVELTKSFRGMILQEMVSIPEVTRDQAAFRVSNSEICAALEGEVCLQNGLFPRPVVAKIKCLNPIKGMLTLYDFAYVNTEWKKRQHERVQPKPATYVTLHWRGKTVRPYVRNVSVDGMGVMAYRMLEKGVQIQPGSTVHLDFELPPDHKFIAVKGTVIYLEKRGSLATAIGMRLFPKIKETRCLEKYVARRKQEIFEELENLFCELSAPRGVENLYF